MERLVRALETRCQTTSLSRRLLHAVRLWSDNGGTLCQLIAGTAADGDEAEEPGVSPLPRHRVLEPGYILKSKAFMLTFNSDTFDRGTWAGFERWVKVKHKEFGARAWAACIKESPSRNGHATHTRVSDGPLRVTSASWCLQDPQS